MIDKKWWEKVLLFFVRKRYRTIRNTVIVYKKLFDKEYFVRSFIVPPKHFNCRCITEVSNEQEKKRKKNAVNNNVSLLKCILKS